MPAISRKFGPLTGHLVDELPAGKKPRLGVILCHGYGAPGTDLTALTHPLLQVAPQLAGHVQFLFPEAPLSLAEMGMPGGRAWWQFSVQRLLSQLQTGRFEEVRNVNPEGMQEACAALQAAVEEWHQSSGLDWSRTVIGGFSQGAMLSLETAASLTARPAGVIALSGTLVHEGHWKSGMLSKPRLPILQTHGRMDTVLPYLAAEWLRDMLQTAEAQLTFLPFRGGHEIPWEALEAMGEFLQDRLAEVSPST